MARKTAPAKKKKIVVAVSGGFDPLHAGHVRLFKEAKVLGDKLIVILNNDNWLWQKKGFAFMSQAERAEIIVANRYVDQVVITSHLKYPKDMSVCKELRKLRPDIFANGGDRDSKDSRDKKSSLNPDRALCEKLGIRMVFNVGQGGKIQSSSWLLNKYVQKSAKVFKKRIKKI